MAAATQGNDVPNGDEKRAAIIAQQAAREMADEASGKTAPRPKPRSNWAASPNPPRRPRGWMAKRKPQP